MPPPADRADPGRKAWKLAGQLVLSLGIGAGCVLLVLRGTNLHEVASTLGRVSAGAVLLYLATQVFVHLFRSWRWEFLLRPAGASIPFRRLLPISSVGFMAILALPVRLGELVRPYYAVREGRIRMSAAVGTVAVERIVDGLIVSIVFFASYAAAPPGSYSPLLRASAWLSLCGFLGLTGFLAFALKWTDTTVDLSLRAALLRRLAPRLADRAADKLRSLITGFKALGDPSNLIPFLVQSVLYWGINGLGMWLLARKMGLPVSLGAAYAAMSFTGVVISLPNPPGNIGAFHAGVVLALLAYLPAAGNSQVLAYATALHGIQTVWYVACGLLALPFAGGKGGLGALVRESKAAAAIDGEAA